MDSFLWMENLQSSESAQQSVARFLCRNGYKRGKNKGEMCCCLKEDNVVKHDFYVKYIDIANNYTYLNILYIYDRYIHKFDSKVGQDLEEK